MNAARSDALPVLTACLGWIYFIAWSVSFFPQCILNFRRKSVVGLSFEFLMYNLTGFLFYAVFSVTTFVTESKHDMSRSVHINDISFALFALSMTLFTIGQCMIYEVSSTFPDAQMHTHTHLHTQSHQSACIHLHAYIPTHS